MEADLSLISANTVSAFRAITWDLVKQTTSNDGDSQDLIHFILSGFPTHKSALPANISGFWNQREHLHIIDTVVMIGERIVIPKPLRPEIIQSLHSAHQGVTAMSDRARSAVYWPGITHDIELIHASCFECNRIAPSQSKLPPVEPHIPTTPLEAIACDYFF